MPNGKRGVEGEGRVLADVVGSRRSGPSRRCRSAPRRAPAGRARSRRRRRPGSGTCCRSSRRRTWRRSRRAPYSVSSDLGKLDARRHLSSGIDWAIAGAATACSRQRRRRCAVRRNSALHDVPPRNDFCRLTGGVDRAQRNQPASDCAIGTAAKKKPREAGLPGCRYWQAPSLLAADWRDHEGVDRCIRRRGTTDTRRCGTASTSS